MTDKNLPKVTNGEPPATLIQAAVQSGADLDKLEKLLELQLKWEKNEAKKAYHEAMVNIQAEIPVIHRDKKNLQTNSSYSAYETIVKVMEPIHTKYGISITMYEGETNRENNIRVCGDVRHRLGHTETYWTDVPLDDKGPKGSINKTQTHAKGSSISYGRSYLLRMIFNIPTGDDDNGNNAGNNYITEEQVGILLAIMDQKKMPTTRREKFLKWAGAKTMEEIPANKYKDAKMYLDNLRVN